MGDDSGRTESCATNEGHSWRTSNIDSISIIVLATSSYNNVEKHVHIAEAARARARQHRGHNYNARALVHTFMRMHLHAHAPSSITTSTACRWRPYSYVGSRSVEEPSASVWSSSSAATPRGQQNGSGSTQQGAVSSAENGLQGGCSAARGREENARQARRYEKFHPKKKKNRRGAHGTRARCDRGHTL